MVYNVSKNLSDSKTQHEDQILAFAQLRITIYGRHKEGDRSQLNMFNLQIYNYVQLNFVANSIRRDNLFLITRTFWIVTLDVLFKFQRAFLDSFCSVRC